MKYLVIGAGGTGGAIAGFLTNAGVDVTLIARGAHLEAIKQNGLKILRASGDLVLNVKACTESEYSEKADVIFVCVKFYSLTETYDLILKASHEKTVVIPVLNVYGTGEIMAKHLAGVEVLNGCIYIASAIKSVGVLEQSGEIFRIAFGRLDGNVSLPILKEIEADLAKSNITPILSENIRKDTMKKFTFVSCMAAAGGYFGGNAGVFKREGKERETYIACIKEVLAISSAMGIEIEEDMVAINLKIMDDLDDSFTTSMQKDLAGGGKNEADGLIFEVVRLGEKHGVATPTYSKIAKFLQEKE